MIPNLKDENKTLLVGTILSQKQTLSHHHTIQVNSSKENFSVPNMKLSRVLD